MTGVRRALYSPAGPPHPFGAAGHYMMDPQALDRFRKAVADNKRGRELDRILAALTKKGFSIDSHGTYARVPKGYDPAHPRAEHLKRKGLTVGFPELPKGILTKPKLVPWLATQAKTAGPFVEWLVFAPGWIPRARRWAQGTAGGGRGSPPPTVVGAGARVHVPG